jgi:hypothetical protein
METRVINPAMLSRCAGGLAYLWLINGESGWLYIIGVYDNAVAGYTWTKAGWVYTGVSTDFINGFYCYG